MEKIKYFDESEKEFDIKRLGFRKAVQIAKKHIPIDSLTFNKETDEITISGNIDLFGMQVTCLETIVGLDLDQLSNEEASRIYQKYFEKDIMASMGKGGNPK